MIRLKASKARMKIVYLFMKLNILIIIYEHKINFYEKKFYVFNFFFFFFKNKKNFMQK